MTLVPTRPAPDRAQAMLDDCARLLDSVAALQADIAAALAQAAPRPSSAERDVTRTLADLDRKVNQAQREVSDGRAADARDTLGAIDSVLRLQLPVQVQAWRSTADAETGAVLDRFIMVLAHFETLEALCS